MPSSIQKSEPLSSKKIYYIKDAELITGRNRLTLRRWWKKSQFPKPILLSRRLAWLAETVDQWISQSMQGGTK